jgi:MarR family transcriptional regulator, temperature-dependent positive regulator of motility
MNANALNRSPIHLLHRAAQSAGEAFDAVIGKKHLTPRQLLTMAAVANNEGSSQTDIVGLTNIDRSTLADIIRRLQRRGWVQRRRRKEDARAYNVNLTQAGRQVLRDARPLSNRIDTRILAALPVSQRERFVEMLSSIVKTLEKASSRDGGTWLRR